MKDDDKRLNKLCPACKKEYPQGYDFCRSDGARLLDVDTDAPSSKARLGRDSDSGARRVTGRAEKG
jgi:hypothetical protein